MNKNNAEYSITITTYGGKKRSLRRRRRRRRLMPHPSVTAVLSLSCLSLISPHLYSTQFTSPHLIASKIKMEWNEMEWKPPLPPFRLSPFRLPFPPSLLPHQLTPFPSLPPRLPAFFFPPFRLPPRLFIPFPSSFDSFAFGKKAKHQVHSYLTYSFYSLFTIHLASYVIKHLK